MTTYMPLLKGQKKDREIDNIYQGNWVNNKRSGEGKITWKNPKSDKVSYGGILGNDLPNGKGLMTYKNQETYAGYWKDGKRDEYGELRYPDGRMKYEGEWVNDLYHGKGTLYSYDYGKVQTKKGSFENGIILA